MVCDKCGKTIRDDSVFCTYCGSKIERVDGMQALQPDPAQPGYGQPDPAQEGYVQQMPAQPGYVQQAPVPTGYTHQGQAVGAPVPNMGGQAPSFTYTIQDPAGAERINQYDKEKVMSAQESSWNANIAAAADRNRDVLTAADLQQLVLDAQFDSAPASEPRDGIHPISVILYLLAAAYLGLEIYSIVTSGNLSVMSIIEYLFLNLLIPAALLVAGVIVQMLSDIRSYMRADVDKRLTVGKLQIKRKQ